MPALALSRHVFALGFFSLALVVSLGLGLTVARQAAHGFTAPQTMVAIFPPGASARASREAIREAIREAGALPRRELLGGVLVSFVVWDPQQIMQLERSGAFSLALFSRPSFTLGCGASVPP
ncbi:hypothetical protein [Billgrantia desiderata]|uniref:hypothetical protein n=1 Tax=Billgrantia desiderata TaxID=52021 RepID=UPI00089EBD55|nr:hypothetical protein [Halomonas desiderata]SEG19549.1 hypothetical protein SAMN04487953_11729 [Halomonas desiderata]